ncbi:MAG: DUF433 domain-containing protein [bacterium]
MPITNIPNRKVKHPYIARKKGVCGGKPIINGTRIKVAQIAIEYEQMGWTPDEILHAHPHLTLPQVHDALSYYYENASEINTDIRAGEQLVEELRKQYPDSLLEVKLGSTQNLHE